MRRKLIYWAALPVALLCGAGAGILALPGLVSSASHRSTIEALASSLTGRKVHIGGNLSLSLFPQPQLIAGNVTIDANNGEAIKAKSLTLDIAIAALLHGQLTASTLILQSPVIAFPWPLPGGPGAIAPPPWLTALHAQINDGRISFGGLTFSNVSADIFTGSNGAVSISGNGKLYDQPINLTLSLGGIGFSGQAPLAIQLSTNQILAHFSGNFSTDNTISGTIAASQSGQAWLSQDATQKLYLAADINADPDHIALTNLTLNQGAGRILGQAKLDFANLNLDMNLSGSNISLPVMNAAPDLAPLQNFKIHNDVSVDKLTIGSASFSHVSESSDISRDGVTIISSAFTLPGNGVISAQGSIDQAGNLQAQAKLSADDFWPLLGTTGGDAQSVSIATPISGTLNHINLTNITGTLGGSELTGSAIIAGGAQPSINSQWHFKQLNLLPVANMLQHTATDDHISGNFDLTADKASLENIALTHLVVDAGFAHNLTIRRLSASLYNGLLAASLSLQPDGRVAAAHAFLNLPSAMAVAALLKPWAALPPAVLNAPFAISLSAAGAPSALATSAVATLGQFSITASPVIDLTRYSLAGPITLRHPSAIAAFKLFGVNAGLPWPGAGSVSLRADMEVSSAGFGLPNFVISLGDLTAAGNLSRTSGNSINANITADTLALPKPPADLSAFWKILPSLNGKIGITANRVLLQGDQWLGASAGNVTMQPGKIALNIDHAAFSGGNLAGSFALSQTLPQAPVLAANFTIQKADAAQAEFPLVFPVTFPTGIADVKIDTNATGYSPQTWAATLGGTMNLQIKNGSIAGFNLAGLATALAAPNRAGPLKAAAQSGLTDFTALDAIGNVDHGIIKLGNATLQGTDGSASVSGSIDLSDKAVDLNFGLVPNVTPPVTIGLTMIGNWSNPRIVPALKQAMSWQAKN